MTLEIFNIPRYWALTIVPVKLTEQWAKIDGNWYYFDKNGYLVHNKWIDNYYLKSDGKLAHDEWIGSYYLDSYGVWISNKKKITEGWQKGKAGYWYQNADGSYPKNQWKEINSKWYHFNKDGYMDHDKWIGDYYVKQSGEMAKNEWIRNYYVDEKGKWIPNKKKIT